MPGEAIDPTRELADLRAALRMPDREPGPAGLTTLSVPSDRSPTDEVRPPPDRLGC
jgi:hypothetical protein